MEWVETTGKTVDEAMDRALGTWVFIATTQKLKYWRNPKLDSSVGSAAKLACELVFARAVRAKAVPSIRRA